MEKRDRIVRYVTGALFILMGTGFVFIPAGMLSFCLWLLGLALAGAAVAAALLYYAGSRMQKDFLWLLLGLAGGVLGVSFLVNPGWGVILFTVLTGIAVILAGSFLIFRESRREDSLEKKWRLSLLAGIGICAVGLAIVMFPGLFTNYLLRVLGAVMIVTGADGIRRTLR